MKLHAANLAYTTILEGLTDVSDEILVNDITVFPEAPYIVVINTEIIYVGTSNTITSKLSDLIRGYEGTTPIAHEAGDTIANKITAKYINELNDDVHSHNEPYVILEASTDNIVTINCKAGRKHKCVVTDNIAEIKIIEASSNKYTGIELELMYAGESTAFSVGWMVSENVVVENALVSVESSIQTFLAIGQMTENVNAGDDINVTGFVTTGSTLNNGLWRVVDANDNLIKVLDPDTNLATCSTGDSITITRYKDYFNGGVTPDAPDPYEPVTYEMHSHDGNRWKINTKGTY